MPWFQGFPGFDKLQWLVGLLSQVFFLSISKCSSLNYLNNVVILKWMPGEM